MKDLSNEAFFTLFKDAYQKCFGVPLTSPMSETESKHFGSKIFDATGLVIGAKSIKNYSLYILNASEAKHENPSVATLDTLARFVLNAPYTDELQRKDKEAHYPYWFQYKASIAVSQNKKPGKKTNKTALLLSLGVLLVFASVGFIRLFTSGANTVFVEHFNAVTEDSLKENGWLIKSKDSFWFNKGGNQRKYLTLYTLRGDNWPDSVNAPEIKNLLLRRIDADCFTAEIHIDDFMPTRNWQQAGVILMEDTSLSGKSVRLSIAYNDFFGGYTKPGEIIIQAISSGGKDLSKPEEIAHLPIFNTVAGNENLIRNNLRKAGLRIEKNGPHFRFLYSTSPVENSAFKEAFSRDLMLKPKYIGVFALQGFVNDTNHIPAHVKFFSLIGNPCED